LLNYEAVFEPARLFISSMGRVKYLSPIYKALINSNKKSLAVDWLSQNLNFYHPYAIEKINNIIGHIDLLLIE
jgi:hypothetical protein